MTFAGLGYAVRRPEHIAFGVIDQLKGSRARHCSSPFALLTGALCLSCWHAWDTSATCKAAGRHLLGVNFPVDSLPCSPHRFALAGLQVLVTAARNLISEKRSTVHFTTENNTRGARLMREAGAPISEQRAGPC